ncbi:MAG: glycosyl hydrolase 115 family protein, partial [Gemmatirosa sp.]|nr:glycosyl hydrolase 115 family protein [Gemmatirosa sp.]
SRKIDVSAITGKWESFFLQTVDNPLPGIKQALVIVGSDKRGTIYGIYDLSQQIGVSPWVWWADVPVKRQASLYVLPGRRAESGPVVKYRGIFINDEAPNFSGWTAEKFGGANHLAYEKMFELILRMKGNYLWPAMWGRAFADDDSISPRLADEYGIVMGTSHHEPLTRAQAEWARYGKGPWDYEKNDSTLRAFWRGGMERMGTRENVVTVGMRGDGDMPMTQGTAIGLLERIVRDQRQIIADVTHKPATETPQMWALYKEVQDYYDKGMRVPDDVTLLFSDDNWGNIRRLPNAKDRMRPGGFGVYYHFDYVGGPRSYKWINTNPIARVWEQMHLAHEMGANRIWVVNVGDLKPMEMPIQFFLDYAWNPEAIPAERLPEWTRRWAAQQFGEANASDVADVVTTTLKYAGRRKPELLDTATYSLTNFREAETVVAQYDTLRARAERIGRALPKASQDAYYELVLHPVLAAANLHALYYTVARNRQYAQQGRARTNDLADSARALFDRDAEITRYYNSELAGGKWSHMMDQTHIGYVSWSDPQRNVMPRVDVIQVPVPAEMGVAVVEQNRYVPPRPAGGFAFPPGGPRGPSGPALPAFDAYQRQTWHVDVYDRGQTPFEFTAQADAPYVTLSPARGRVDKEQRVAVSVDWARAPAGTHRVPITFTGPNGAKVVVQTTVANPAGPARDSVVGFVEGAGYVSMEAEHYARAVGTGPTQWLRIPDLGRTLSGMTPASTIAPTQTPGAAASPRLEYRVFLFDSGAVKVRAYLSPTHNVLGATHGLRYAMSFDDDKPVVVDIHADSSSIGRTDGNRAWEQSVADNIKQFASQHTLAKPGAHVLKFWMVDPAVVLQKLVIETADLPQSYLGPPESFRGGAPTTAPTRVSAATAP